MAVTGRIKQDGALILAHEIFLISDNIFQYSKFFSNYPYLLNILISLLILIPLLIKFPRKKQKVISREDYPVN